MPPKVAVPVDLVVSELQALARVIREQMDLGIAARTLATENGETLRTHGWFLKHAWTLWPSSCTFSRNLQHLRQYLHLQLQHRAP